MTPPATFLAVATILASPALAAPTFILVRQLAGEGNACSSLLSSTDNGVGYGIENAEDNTANLLKPGSVKAPGTTGSSPSKIRARQGDKIANGANALLSAAGQPGAGSFVGTNGDNVDGQLTGDATDIGAQFGGDEESILEGLGASIP